MWLRAAIDRWRTLGEYLAIFKKPFKFYSNPLVDEANSNYKSSYAKVISKIFEIPGKYLWSSYSCTVFYVNSLDSYLTSEAHWEPYETSKTAKFSENSQRLLVVNCFRKARRLRCLTEFRMHFCVWLLNLLSFSFEKLNWTLIKLELIKRRSFENFYSLREKRQYSDLFWSEFFCIRTKYGEILRISPYSVRMWENEDQNNSEYGHFLRSDCYIWKCY